MISIIHPSRDRVERAFRVFEKTTKNSTLKDYEYILSIDVDDPRVHEFEARFKGKVNILKSPNKSAMDAINRGAEISKGDILMVLSDDFDDMPVGWDKMIVDATAGKKDWILRTSDGHEDWIITMPIMDREYYNRFGYIYYPGYQHLFCDTEMTTVADYLGKSITRKDIVFKHNHYTVAKNKDKINEKNDRTWAQGESLYLERFKTNFGLNEDVIVGNITGKKHMDWLNKKTGNVVSEIPIKPKKEMMWSILIPTIKKRESMFLHIYNRLNTQIESALLKDKIEILHICDNGEKSIGQKRNELVERACGKYISFVDDDDDVSELYIGNIYTALQSNPDCVSLKGMYSVDGVDKKPFIHSLRYNAYSEDSTAYYRPPNHLNAIKKELISHFKFPTINFGEDTDWAMQICKSGVLKNEVYIDRILYLYKYISKK